MQRLILPEMERVVADMYVLGLQADQVAFAGAAAGIIDGIVFEFVPMKMHSQLAVDPVKQLPLNARVITLQIEVVCTRRGWSWDVCRDQTDKQQITGLHG